MGCHIIQKGDISMNFQGHRNLAILWKHPLSITFSSALMDQNVTDRQTDPDRQHHCIIQIEMKGHIIKDFHCKIDRSAKTVYFY